MKDLVRHHGRLDLELIENFITVLKPFKDATVLMSSQRSVTVSLLKPLLAQLMVVWKPSNGESKLSYTRQKLISSTTWKRGTGITSKLNYVNFCECTKILTCNYDSHVHTTIIVSVWFCKCPRSCIAEVYFIKFTPNSESVLSYPRCELFIIQWKGSQMTYWVIYVTHCPILIELTDSVVSESPQICPLVSYMRTTLKQLRAFIFEH